MAFESCNNNIKSNVWAQNPERCCCTINIREYKNVPLTFILPRKDKNETSLVPVGLYESCEDGDHALRFAKPLGVKTSFPLSYTGIFLLCFPQKTTKNRQKNSITQKPRDKSAFINPRLMMTMVSSNRRFEKKTPFRATILLMMIVIVALFSNCSQVSAQEQHEGGLSRKFSIHNTDDTKEKDDFKDSDGDGVGDFKDAFVSSLAMILVAELGDETFIIAAIMAMRHPRLIVLSGALSALAIMTVLSTAMGVLAPMLISPKVVNKCAFVLYTPGADCFTSRGGQSRGVQCKKKWTKWRRKSTWRKRRKGR